MQSAAKLVLAPAPNTIEVIVDEPSDVTADTFSKLGKEIVYKVRGGDIPLAAAVQDFKALLHRHDPNGRDTIRPFSLTSVPTPPPAVMGRAVKLLNDWVSADLLRTRAAASYASAGAWQMLGYASPEAYIKSVPPVPSTAGADQPDHPITCFVDGRLPLACMIALCRATSLVALDINALEPAASKAYPHWVTVDVRKAVSDRKIGLSTITPRELCALELLYPPKIRSTCTPQFIARTATGSYARLERDNAYVTFEILSSF